MTAHNPSVVGSSPTRPTPADLHEQVTEIAIEIHN